MIGLDNLISRFTSRAIMGIAGRKFRGLLYVTPVWSWADQQDTVNGNGLRYQPELYLLKQSIGGYPAGTILLAGNSIPADLSTTQLDLYASTDNGASWKFVSHIANGGEAVSPFPSISNTKLNISDPTMA
jgi:hypothetical protein